MRRTSLIALIVALMVVLTHPSSASADWPAPLAVPGVTFSEPKNGAAIEAAGSIDITVLSAPWKVSSAAVEICRSGSDICLSTAQQFDNGCNTRFYEKALSLELDVKPNSPGLGEAHFLNSQKISYQIALPGRYQLRLVQVERYDDPSYSTSPNDTCWKSQVSINVEVKPIPKLNPDDGNFWQQLATYNPTFGAYIICDDGDYDETKPGQAVTCEGTLKTSKLVEGTVPLELLVGVCKSPIINTCQPTLKVVGTSTGVLGMPSSFKIRVPSTKNVDTVQFGARIKGLPATLSTFTSSVVQPVDTSTVLKVSVRGPSQVIRGKSITLTVSTSPSGSGSCQLTSHPGASDWGNLGNFILRSGVLKVSVRLNWPLSYGDGIGVGVTAKCKVGKRFGQYIFYSQGFLP